MPLIAFKEINMYSKNVAMVERINLILRKYIERGQRVTLRQLYYRLVAGSEGPPIPNNLRSYKRVGDVVNNGRLGGFIDWDAIEDRVREPSFPGEFSDLDSLAQAAMSSFRLPRRADQPKHIEIATEKDALSGVLAPLASEYHVTMVVNRGYTSQSAMYQAALRYQSAIMNDKEVVLLYVGDHDPSGLDMVRDIKTRMKMFGITRGLKVERVALTWAQIEEYEPPENPVKPKDVRTPKYREEFGERCWEVDALPPEVLDALIRKAIEKHTDKRKLNAAIKREGPYKARWRLTTTNADDFDPEDYQ